MSQESSYSHTYPAHLPGTKEDGGPRPVQSQLTSVETQGDHSLLCETSQLFPDNVGAIPETDNQSGHHRARPRVLLPASETTLSRPVGFSYSGVNGEPCLQK